MLVNNTKLPTGVIKTILSQRKTAQAQHFIIKVRISHQKCIKVTTQFGIIPTSLKHAIVLQVL